MSTPPNLRQSLGRIFPGDYFDLDDAFLVFGKNEWALWVKNDNDPGGFSIIGFTSSKVSWKDAAGSEKVLLQLRQNAKGDGEIYFGCYSQARFDAATARGGAWAAQALDYAMEEVATLNPDGFEIRAPLKASAGIVGVVAASSAATTVRTSANGRFVDVLQDDGNEVTYDTHLGTVGDPAAAVYGTRNGWIRDIAAT